MVAQAVVIAVVLVFRVYVFSIRSKNLNKEQKGRKGNNMLTVKEQKERAR